MQLKFSVSQLITILQNIYQVPNWVYTLAHFLLFSFHEIAVFDLPTMFDYVISVTGKKQMYYVGHSQGGTTFFICMAMRPEYNDAFKLMVALAPGVVMSHTQSLLLRILSVSDSFNVSKSLLLELKFLFLRSRLSATSLIRGL